MEDEELLEMWWSAAEKGDADKIKAIGKEEVLHAKHAVVPDKGFQRSESRALRYFLCTPSPSPES